MKRVLIISAILIFANVGSGEASWFTDKLNEVGKDLGDRLMNDAADSTYDKTRESAGNAASQDAEQAERQEAGYAKEKDTEDPTEAEEEGDSEEQPSWATQRSHAPKQKKPYTHKDVRRDLQFSADTVAVDPDSPGQAMQGKLFVDGARFRNDMSTPEGSMSTIITGPKPEDQIIHIMHQQKGYMTTPVGTPEDDLWGMFRDMEKSCEGYRKSKNLGQKTINGRKADGWSCSDPEDPADPSTTTAWIDSKLKIPIKFEDSDGSSYELKNIKEGKPAAANFEIPKGYSKFSFGQDKSATDNEAILGKAGVPVYPGAVFCTGTTKTGLRYATSDSVEQVRKWYQAKRSGWQLMNEPKFDIWVLYQGPPDIKMMEWMNYNMAQVNENKEMPGWHNLDKGMTTEIVLGVADQYK